MKNRLFAFAVGFCALIVTGSAQDVHFSQFNASPLTLNPALTGKLPCTYRAAINYRNQWNTIPAPYVTYSGAFDAALWKHRLGGDAVGVGMLLMNDVSGDGNLTNMGANISLAYHKALGENHILSAGFQGTFVQKNVDINNLIFNSQIDGNGNINPGSGEPFQGGFNYFDLQAGIHWSAILSDNFSINLGGAYYHILRPVETFLNDNSNRLDPRYVGHGGVMIGMGDALTLSPSVLYMYQSGAQELNVGSSMTYNMESASLFAGLWYRNMDAVIALTGIEVAQFTFGFSYDVTVSGAAKANNHQGAFELSLTYNGCVEPKPRVLHCPQF